MFICLICLYSGLYLVREVPGMSGNNVVETQQLMAEVFWKDTTEFINK